MYLNIYYERNSDDSSPYHPGWIHIWDSEFGYKKLPYQRYAYKLDSKGQYKTLYGDSVKIVKRWSKEDEESGIIFESDVTPEMRYLIDNYAEFDTPPKSHVEMFFDIEVDTQFGLPNISTAQNEITSISYYIRNENIYRTFIVDKNGEIDAQSYETLEKESIEILTFHTEREMLEGFIQYYSKSNVNILIGWNSANFDIPYLYNRLVNLFGDDFANKLSPIGIVRWSDRYERYKIAGVSCLDYMELYKTFTTGERTSFSLDAIGKREVKIGKIKYDGTLDKLYKESKEKYIQYNINDVRIIVKIDEKLKFIDLTRGICHKGHVQYEDVFYSSRYLDGAILTYMKLRNLVAPNRPNKGTRLSDDGEKFEGAYVKDPIPGKYKWVVDCDMQSLYPSIIMSLNISPETKVAMVDGWNSASYKSGKDSIYKIQLSDKLLELDNNKMRKFLSETNFSISSNGVLYDVKTPGIIPEILSKWFNERVEYKDLMKKHGKEKNTELYEFYHMRQYIQKVILNSMYGVLGLKTFRFYDLDNALAVTSTGQDLIKFAQTIVNHYFSKQLGDNKDYVIYADTDSIFFSVEELIKKKHADTDWSDKMSISNSILKVTKDIQDYINKSMDYFGKEFLNLSKHRFFMKQEIIASSGFWTAKKRYALNVINREGIPIEELEIKGLDVIRTSFPKAFSEFMRNLLKDILNDVEKHDIDLKILELKKSMWSHPISDLARPTGVKEISKYYDQKNGPFQRSTKGTPAHVKAAMNYNDFIRHLKLENKFRLVSDGEKIKWLYLKDNPLRISEMAFRDNGEDPSEILEYLQKYIDLEKVFDSEVESKFTDFYTALQWGPIPTNINQNASKFF